MNDNIKNIQN